MTRPPSRPSLGEPEVAGAEPMRTRLDVAHCVFDFLVRPAPPQPSEADHRVILDDLFRSIDGRIVAGFITRTGRHPNGDLWRPRWNINAATATHWNEDDLVDPQGLGPDFRVTLEGRDAARRMHYLGQAFHDPPYGADCPPGLFADWCALVGLWPGEGATILDWVDVHGHDDAVTPWNSYFEPGLEWWGVWCLTIHNPQRGTLAALAASETD